PGSRARAVHPAAGARGTGGSLDRGARAGGRDGVRQVLRGAPGRSGDQATGDGGVSRVGITLPAGATQALEARLQHLDRDHFARRLFDRDPTLWGADPARQQVAARRLGWLTAPATMKTQAPALRAFRDECAAERLDQAILIGMGGSSLAPEVLRDTFGMNTHPASGGEARATSASSRSSLTVLDTTSPDEVGAALAAHDPLRTLCIVSSKSGSTIEVSSLEKCCYEWARAARGDTVGRGFVAVTDPGTALERLASDR